MRRNVNWLQHEDSQLGLVNFPLTSWTDFSLWLERPDDAWQFRREPQHKDPKSLQPPHHQIHLGLVGPIQSTYIPPRKLLRTERHWKQLELSYIKICVYLYLEVWKAFSDLP